MSALRERLAESAWEFCKEHPASLCIDGHPVMEVREDLEALLLRAASLALEDAAGALCSECARGAAVQRLIGAGPA